MKNNNYFLVLLLTVFAWSSCNPIKEVHQFHSIPTQGWSKTDTLEFVLPQLKSTPLTIDIQIRTTQTYPYRDLYLLCEENLSDSILIQKDTLHLNLSDSTGRWQGAGIGYYYQSSFTYKALSPLQQKEQAHIKISSLMNDSILPGISDLGVHIY